MRVCQHERANILALNSILGKDSGSILIPNLGNLRKPRILYIVLFRFAIRYVLYLSLFPYFANEHICYCELGIANGTNFLRISVRMKFVNLLN